MCRLGANASLILEIFLRLTLAGSQLPYRYEPKNTTIRDVAARAGVSAASVSNVINGRGRISDEKRKLILAIIEEMQFKPDLTAKTLSGMRSMSVGLLTDDRDGRFSFPIMAGLTEALADRGVLVFMSVIDGDRKAAKASVEAFLNRRVDGLVIAGSRTDLVQSLDLSGIGIPVAYAVAGAPPNSRQICPDNRHGARLAADWLKSQGRQRIVHVTGPEHHLETKTRLAGYCDIVGSVAPPLFGDWSEAWGRAAVLELRASGRSFDAVFCGNDQVARGVLEGLHDAGIAVPNDIAVVGFENWEVLAESARPPLTSVDLGLKAIGRRLGAVVLEPALQANVEGPELLPCSLVVRQSCGGADESQTTAEDRSD